jgi:hypothetical protein
MNAPDEMNREIAFEAARRSASVNPHELWAALDAVEALGPKVIVDLRSEPAVWWAWWSLGARVIGVSATPTRPSRGFSGERLPSSVTEIVADPREQATRLRVSDQLAGGLADVLVLGGPATEDDERAIFHAYAPLVRPKGLVLVHGIANAQLPGIGRFWSELDADERTELIGSQDPDGYGLVEIHERKSADHG